MIRWTCTPYPDGTVSWSAWSGACVLGIVGPQANGLWHAMRAGSLVCRGDMRLADAARWVIGGRR